jgi:hypothetical protein
MGNKMPDNPLYPAAISVWFFSNIQVLLKGWSIIGRTGKFSIILDYFILARKYVFLPHRIKIALTL